MAKRINESAAGADKAKVRVFFAEVDGNNASVQEALRTMLSAMSRPVRVISEQKINGNAAVLLQHDDAEVIDELTDQLEEAEMAGEETSPQNARKARGAGKKIDRNAGLKWVADLEFRPNGKQTFKEFMNEKSPKNDLEVTLAAVYYMQHIMALPKIGPAHVMTAFKEAGKSIPVDVRQTVRNAKNHKVWLNFTDIEEIRTTTQGDNFVMHDMGGANNS